MGQLCCNQRRKCLRTGRLQENDVPRDAHMEIGDSVAGWAIKNRKFLYVKNVDEDEEFKKIKKENIKSGTLMCAPLVSKDKIMGVLNVSKSIPAPP